MASDRGPARARAGLLTVWGNAWLAGRAAYDEVVEQVTGPDEPHRVSSLDPAGAVPLGWALSRLRQQPGDGLRLVLPVPGDPRGLPTGSEFAATAMQTGEGVLGHGLGLVPVLTRHGSAHSSQTITVDWRAFPVESGVAEALDVSEAEHDLSDALRTAASGLAALDVASWRPEMAEAVANLRQPGPLVRLPAGHDPRAARLLAQAERLDTVLAVAELDAPGGSVTAGAARARAELLRPLATAVRRARLAAYNAQSVRRS